MCRSAAGGGGVPMRNLCGPGWLCKAISRGGRCAPFSPALAGNRRHRPRSLCTGALWNPTFPLACSGSRSAFNFDGGGDWRLGWLSRWHVSACRHDCHGSFPLAALVVPVDHRTRAAPAQRVAAGFCAGHVPDSGDAGMDERSPRSLCQRGVFE